MRSEVAQKERARRPLLLLSLAAVTVLAFWPVLNGDFINYDDDVYVSANRHIQQGLTWADVRWAFTTGYGGNWFPLTWLSHEVDVSVFGLNPRGHHATSLALHVVNSLLLFFLLRNLTGKLWRSAGAATLFAIHPAHVESVAWVSERKDLLCAAFWFAAMWAYASWVRRRGPGRYALVLLLFAAGLMSKPMIVTLPLVLLLLDYWPLGRVSDTAVSRLVVEKLPLFVMAAASSLVTFFVQRAAGAVGSLEAFPLWVRLGNAALAYLGYLRILFWPVGLAIFYPHPAAALSGGAALGAAILLLALTGTAIVLRRSAPFLFVGWFWFLVTLLPVIGLVQVGRQAMADRYTYVPFIGLFLALAWGLSAVVSRWGQRRLAAGAVAAAVLLALVLATSAQARIWRTSETVFSHALKVNGNDSVAANYLGKYFNSAGEPLKAISYLSEAAQIDPNDPDIRNNLGLSAFLLGRLDEAAQYFSEARRLGPDSAIPLNNLARTRFLQGEILEATRFYERSLAIASDSAEIHRRLVLPLLMEGKTAAALEHMRRAVALGASDQESLEFLKGISEYERNPNDPSLEQFRRTIADADLKAGAALYGRGKKAEGTARVRQALELSPSFAEAHNELGTHLVAGRPAGRGGNRIRAGVEERARVCCGPQQPGLRPLCPGQAE